MTEIRIDFESGSGGVFYAGQLLRGTVHLTLKDEKKVRGVYIRISGKGQCSWSSGSGKNRTRYSGEELYLNETTYLVGAKEGNVILMQGTQSYNFQCNLPSQLPTSVEGYIGSIRYTARVTVDVPMGFDKELKQRFTVIRPMNLNDNPQLRQPITSATSEQDCCSSFFCCFCICMNPINVSAQIPVSGYTPGQTINVQLHVTHKGSPKNYEFSVKLMRRIDYCAKNNNVLNFFDSGTHYNDETKCITQKGASCRISDTTSAEIVRVDLPVPPVPPTDFNSSNVVKVTYYLKIRTSAGCFNGSPKNVIPITIGTYPIQDFAAPDSNAFAPVLDQPSAPLLDPATGNPYDEELPTYGEAMDMADGNGSGESYKPMYPLFKRRTSYSIGQ